MRTHIFLFCTFFIISFGFAAQAGNVEKDTTINGLKIELHVMPAEPFFTKQEADAKKVSSGMLILEGNRPLALDDSTHPNHHLVVHVYDSKSGKALTQAKVKISFQPINETGKLSGSATDLPIIKMQAIGKGTQSTHYGNNVVMADGSYAILVLINGKLLKFTISTSSDSEPSMEHMHMN